MAADRPCRCHGEGRLHRQPTQSHCTQKPAADRTAPHSVRAAQHRLAGRLICARTTIARDEHDKDGTTRTVLSSGTTQALQRPYDIVVAKTMRCTTDNDFGLSDAAQTPDKQMPTALGGSRTGSRHGLEATVLGGIPNGITLSPDEKYLYANAGQRMFRYEVKTDGSLGSGSLFTQGPGIGDGMKVDTLGNVYSTSGAGPGIVRITSPTGTLLGYLNLPIAAGNEKQIARPLRFGVSEPDRTHRCDHVDRIRIERALSQTKR